MCAKIFSSRYSGQRGNVTKSSQYEDYCLSLRAPAKNTSAADRHCSTLRHTAASEGNTRNGLVLNETSSDETTEDEAAGVIFDVALWWYSAAPASGWHSTDLRAHPVLVTYLCQTAKKREQSTTTTTGRSSTNVQLSEGPPCPTLSPRT